jgi:hypothetical protein
MHSEYYDDEARTNRDIRPQSDDETDVESQDRHLHIRTSSQSSENGLPIPVWMRESAKSFKYTWVPLPLRKAGRAAATWIKGPSPPRELRIQPIYPKIQEAPLRLMDRYVPKQRHRICLLIALYAAWFLTWSLMLKHNSTSGYIEGYGKPANIWCGASFWLVVHSNVLSALLITTQERRKRLRTQWEWLQTLLIRPSCVSLPC